ncbi:MAG: ubiquitin-like small modifier protein 1 [Candidatus Eisenbacteria bacterium]
MAVSIHIPGHLRQYTGGAARVDFSPAPATVGAALSALWERHPGVRDRVVTERGDVRTHVNVFVGSESIRYLGGLDAQVADGEEISIIPAVSGG